MSQDKFEVKIDTENHTLYVDIEVKNRAEWQGTSYYDTRAVLTELNRQGYNLTERDCIEKPTCVRSDVADCSKGRWVFELAKTETPEKEKTAPVEKTTGTEEKKAPTKKTRKKTTRQTTKSVLESYKKR
jgi:hypothetical protein